MPIGSDAMGALWYIDTENIADHIAWAKTVEKNGAYTLSRYQFDESGRFRSESTTLYDPAGALIASSQTPSEWTIMLPDSTAEKVHHALKAALNR